jgi:hypothetical protein
MPVPDGVVLLRREALIQAPFEYSAYSMEGITHQLYHDQGRRQLEVKLPWKPKTA